ncbi:MAG: mechanosensitive channel MscK [Pseudomonas sp.]
MSRLTSLLLYFFFAANLLLVAPLQADTVEVGSTIETIQTELKTLAESSLPDAEKRELQDIYQNTLIFLQRIESVQKEQADLRRKLDSAPEQLRTIRQQIERQKVQDSDTLRQRYTSQGLDTLGDLLSEKVGQMFAWQNQLTDVNGELISAQTRPERTQAQVASNQTREQALSEQRRLLQRQTETPHTQARLRLLQAEQQSLQESNRLMRQQLSANSVLQDLATQQRNLLRQQIVEAEMEVMALQEVINDKRREQSEQTVSETTTQAQQTSDHQLLREQGSLNQSLSEELLAATNRLGELTAQNILTLQQIESLTQVDRALEQQISVLEGSVLLSRILHQQKRSLPKVNLDANVADQIADLRLRQFELTSMRDELESPDTYLSSLLRRLSADQREDLRDDMQQVIASRTNLVEQLSSNINTLLSQAITLQINQRQLQQLSNDLQRTIDDQLFWVASNRPVDRAWLVALPTQVVKQWNNLHLVDQGRTFVSRMSASWPWLVLLALLVGLHTWWRPRGRAKLLGINEDVGHFRRDSSTHTPKALLLSALLILPVPVTLAALGLILSLGIEPVMPVLGDALLQLALAWFVLHVLYRVLDPRGIAARHFRWDVELVQRLHRLTRNMAWIMVPMVLIIALSSATPESLAEDVMGRSLTVLGMLLLSILLGHMMWRSEPLYHSRVLHMTATLVLTLTPLALAGMSIWGYHYTSIKLADRFIDTLYLIVLWMLVEGTVVRNLNVAGRRLAYQRALSKREAAQNRDGQDSEIAVEIPEMDIQQVNQQSLRLAKLGILILFGILVYLVWADLISAASYLDSVTLWEYNSGTADNPLMAPMSAADILGALLIVVFTVTLARNLPGLLEMLILSRMDLQQGSSYAVTTLLSYTIFSIGIISGLSSLGVSWDKLQWLVAALGVGLGFGLQEIFANFVSGLIILFERPVRIGDVVTIGPLSGTVNRIRIRATTITDFDRKEIIVPNKTFVTEQLINWSLNDTITRVIIKVGVSYGSDLAKTRELMLQIAKDNARVLKDPAPMVLFLSFGDSTLDHELRIHVRELIDRNQAIDEINREIDRQFAEHGIEIAFRQLDVNLRNSEGLEKLVSSRRMESPVPPTEQPEGPPEPPPLDDPDGSTP